jgi:hypothetical protein
MDVVKTRFLLSELDRALDREDTIDRPMTEALASGDLARINDAFEFFMNRTSDTSSYDHELAYGLALDGRGDPAFNASDVSETALAAESSRRVRTRRSIRTDGCRRRDTRDRAAPQSPRDHPHAVGCDERIERSPVRV